METPQTLADAIKYFGDPDNSLRYLAAKRWPNGVECPYCATKEPMFLKSRRIWKCRATDCRKQFSVKVGTVLNESPIPVEKWLTAMWLVANCRNGVSSCEVARDLGLTQKTAWFMLHRIREAMQDKTATKLSGEVEVDESFIGGKSRNMHRSKRARVITGTGGADKAIALGMVETFARSPCRRAASTNFRSMFARTFRPDRRCSVTRCNPTMDFRLTINTPSWITP
jgi:transposase-like protein